MLVSEVHARTFVKSALLSSYQMPKVIPPIDVIRVLNKARISFVLAGAYGLAGWRHESRATEDVDVVVALRQVKKAVRVLIDAFPELEEFELPFVVRLRERAAAVSRSLQTHGDSSRGRRNIPRAVAGNGPRDEVLGDVQHVSRG